MHTVILETRITEHVANWLQPKKGGKVHSGMVKHLLDSGDQANIRQEFKGFYQETSCRLFSIAQTVTIQTFALDLCTKNQFALSLNMLW